MMLRELYITEKPAVATAVVDALDDKKFVKKVGYYIDEEEGVAVAWCIGHMLQLLEPEEYDKKLGFWSFDTLPLFFSNYRHKPNPKLKPNLDVIASLLKKAETVVHAGDTDDEGQLLVDEILRYYDYKKTVYRVLINDNTKSVVKKAIAKKEPNDKYEYLGWRAEARSLSDLLFGFNLTRAYTLKSQAEGGEGVVSVGRVQTPILGLVVRRDRLNSGHKKQYYYRLLAKIAVSESSFVASFIDYTDNLKLKIEAGQGGEFKALVKDDKGRLIDKTQIVQVGRACQGQLGQVVEYEEKDKSESAPLPYNINKLQQDANQEWGYKPKDVVKITQELKDTYQLITYNRSDCQYLSDEQFDNAAEVLAAVAKNTTGTEFGERTKVADSSIKGRVFNSSKVGAHHAIVPTHSTMNISKLTKEQRNIYLLIANMYVAQFYPNSIYKKKKAKILIGDFLFGVSSSTKIEDGWEVLFKGKTVEKDHDNDEEEQDIALEGVKRGKECKCLGLKIDNKETKPPPHYTTKTLLADLTRVAKYVKDQRLAKILIEKDKDKASESGGIGTSATRHVALETLFERGFLVEKGKKVMSTDKGHSFYDKLDDRIKYPDLSAIWAERQLGVQSRQDVINFAAQMMKEVVIPEIQKIKGSIKYYKCPACGRNMIRHNTEKGYFWGCTGFRDLENQCKYSMDDKEGVPIEREQSKAKSAVLTEFDCKVCSHKLSYKKGKKSYYFACTGATCDQIYFKDKKGKKPDYENLPKPR